MARVELARRAQSDVRRLGGEERKRVRQVLERLARGDDNLDVRPLAGSRPWQRLRVGDHRILFRRVVSAVEPEPLVLVKRIVHRSELERAVDSL